MNVSALPSGAQARCSWVVTGSTSNCFTCGPPSNGYTTAKNLPKRAVPEIHLPSGEMSGSVAGSPQLTRTGGPPSTGIFQIAMPSGAKPEYTSQRPSGETLGRPPSSPYVSRVRPPPSLPTRHTAYALWRRDAKNTRRPSGASTGAVSDPVGPGIACFRPFRGSMSQSPWLLANSAPSLVQDGYRYPGSPNVT